MSTKPPSNVSDCTYAPHLWTISPYGPHFRNSKAKPSSQRFLVIRDQKIILKPPTIWFRTIIIVFSFELTSHFVPQYGSSYHTWSKSMVVFHYAHQHSQLLHLNVTLSFVKVVHIESTIGPGLSWNISRLYILSTSFCKNEHMNHWLVGFCNSKWPWFKIC